MLYEFSLEKKMLSYLILSYNQTLANMNFIKS